MQRPSIHHLGIVHPWDTTSIPQMALSRSVPTVLHASVGDELMSTIHPGGSRQSTYCQYAGVDSLATGNTLWPLETRAIGATCSVTVAQSATTEYHFHASFWLQVLKYLQEWYLEHCWGNPSQLIRWGSETFYRGQLGVPPHRWATFRLDVGSAPDRASYRTLTLNLLSVARIGCSKLDSCGICTKKEIWPCKATWIGHSKTQFHWCIYLKKFGPAKPSQWPFKAPILLAVTIGKFDPAKLCNWVFKALSLLVCANLQWYFTHSKVYLSNSPYMDGNSQNGPFWCASPMSILVNKSLKKTGKNESQGRGDEVKGKLWSDWVARHPMRLKFWMANLQRLCMSSY